MPPIMPAPLQRIITASVTAHNDAATIVAVYLFGSRICPGHRPDADLDIAFLIDGQAYRADPVGAVTAAHLAAAAISEALECETDVTVLNAASLEMAYEIVTTGVCVMASQEDRKTGYEIALKGMYFDFKPFLENLRVRCLDAI